MANNSAPGPGVDAQGRAVIDPTANVIANLEAAVKRLDDLLAVNLQRQDDLRTMDSAHLREVATIRATHATEMRKAEADRIDAIRAVDVGNVSRAAEVSATQASVLSTTVAASAETLRATVAASATAAAAALASTVLPLTEAIADLRKTQYEQQGQKAQVTEARDAGAGPRQWTGILVGAGVALFGIFISVVIVIVVPLLSKP